MNVYEWKGANAAEVQFGHWDVALVGEALDQRGQLAVSEARKRCRRVCRLRYRPDELKVDFNEISCDVDDVVHQLAEFSDSRILLEATTLGFAEVLLSCTALCRTGISKFDICYIEPGEYRRSRGAHLLSRRDFELSGEVKGYRAIPGNAILLLDGSPQKGVFFLGYEGSRLRRTFEELEMIDRRQVSLVFGVPAFQPGWEMDSIANNIALVGENQVELEPYFCAADSPGAAVDLLQEIYVSLNENERMFIGPIGTKPHGIGTALFASHRTDIGIIYDHPERTQGRSQEVGSWHLYSVADFASGQR